MKYQVASIKIFKTPRATFEVALGENISTKSSLAT